MILFLQQSQYLSLGQRLQLFLDFPSSTAANLFAFILPTTPPSSCFLWIWLQDSGNMLAYEDRTSRFFPPAPRAPRMPGLVSGDTSFMDDSEDSFGELSNSSLQRFNILCSGDKDGSICFSIFGIFPIGKIVSYSIWKWTSESMLLDWFHKWAVLCTEILVCGNS